MKKLIYLKILLLILGLVLTGCFLSNVGQVPATEQSGMTYVTKGGSTVNEAESFLLYAGQHDLVGEILVWDDGETLCVKYQLNEVALEDGWLIYETHLAVGHEIGEIPQTKKGNPIPGQFLYGDDELDEGVDSWEYCIPFNELGKEESGDLAPIECDETLVIAAHAVIEKEDCIPGDSGTDTYVSDATTMVIAGNVVSAVYPYAAVPTDAGAHYGADTWINQTGTGSWVPAPTWIWESNPVVNPILGDIVWFEKTFNVTGTPTAGELKIAVDNGYAVWLNGKFVGSDNLFLFVGADDDYDTTMLGDLKQAYVDTTTWQTVGIFNLTPYLQTGTNTLKILGANEYMNPDDGGQPVGTVLLNPGGMAFQFTVDWEVPEVCTTYDETAWGAAEEVGQLPFDGANWATYFEYSVECPPCMETNGELTVTGTGWKSVSAWCPCEYKYDLTETEAPVALKGWVDLSDVSVPTDNKTKYYASFSLTDSNYKTIEIVFSTQFLGGWYGLPAQLRDIHSIMVNSGWVDMDAYYNLEGGVLDSGAGPFGGMAVYPSDRKYYLQLIADPDTETFTLQVRAKGCYSPSLVPPNVFPLAAFIDGLTWMDIGTFSVPDFDFSGVSICAKLTATPSANESDNSTITWEDMEVGTPEIW